MQRDRLAITAAPDRAVEGVVVDPLGLATCREAFLRTLEGRKLSPQTIRAYGSDVAHLASWLEAGYPLGITVDQVQPSDIEDYLATLARSGLSGVTLARRLAAIREFFRFLVRRKLVEHSPALDVRTPTREARPRVWLRPDEYSRMVSETAGNPRDYCILQVFLQTGVRVAELCDLRVDDVDLVAKALRVRSGKGNQARDISLEKKGIQALKGWLAARPPVLSDHLFVNRYGDPLSDRGVRKLIAKYRVGAGITKRATPHSLRHTFASYKARRGVTPYMLKEMLGHKNLTTTQLYTHLDKLDDQKVMEATSL